VNSEVTVRLEGLDQLENPITSSGIEPAVFWLEAQHVVLCQIKAFRNDVYIYVGAHLSDCTASV
jgi:hypothetical protein